MKILILAEHDHHRLKNVTYHTVNAATQLGDDIHVLILGKNCESVLAEAKRISSVKRILLADHLVYEHQLAENCAQLTAQLATDYDYVLSAATTFGKNILPRVASLLDVSMVSDVTKIISPDTFLRPMYAGNVIATVQTTDKIKILSIRPSAFSVAEKNDSADIPVEHLVIVITNDLTQFESQQLTVSPRPDLASARIVISGGRGLKDAAHFKLLEALADQLGAAVGASRAAVDAGFAPNDYQVGQTGKIVAPDLYIAVGISGAIQHLAGMKESKVVVAINNDADAPIFQAADYGLVGDLFKILPELQAVLAKNEA